MSNNFKQWNPAAINQQNDDAYAVDAMRTGGAVSGIFSKELANKLFYQVTTMVAAFGEALSNKGYHPSDADLATLITLLSNVLTKADFGSVAGTVCEGNDPRLLPPSPSIPPGSKMWFYQNVAPSGWVLDATPADALLAVRGGSGAYSGDGGTQAGTWTQPGHTHTGPSHTHTFSGAGSHTHTTGDVTLTAAQSGVPAHDHTFYAQVVDLILGDDPTIHWNTPGAGTSRAYRVTTSPFAGRAASQAHNHGATGAATVSGTTGSSGTGATGSSGTAATWRPLAQLGIICKKS